MALELWVQSMSVPERRFGRMPGAMPFSINVKMPPGAIALRASRGDIPRQGGASGGLAFGAVVLGGLLVGVGLIFALGGDEDPVEPDAAVVAQDAGVLLDAGPEDEPEVEKKGKEDEGEEKPGEEKA